MTRLKRARNRSRPRVPNLLTLLRILIVPFVFTTLLYYNPLQDSLRIWAAALFLIGSVTDALDGAIARFSNRSTELGRFLDPLADKLLLLSGYLGLFFAKGFPLLPPLWIIVTIVFRDLVILGGLLVLYLSSGHVQIEPNMLGKVTTAFQMATLVSILFLMPTSPLLWNITAALTIASGFVYVGREMARDRGREKR